MTGFGDAVALVFRLFTGRLSDRTGRHWALSMAGYAVTVVSVPAMAAAGSLWQVAGLVIGERFGKAVRTPARDTMLAQAGSGNRRGWVFAVQEALDQSGALLGPLLVSAMLALSGYRLGFAVLAVPGALCLIVLAWLRAAAPAPSAYERDQKLPPEGADPHPSAPGPAMSSRLPHRAGASGRAICPPYQIASRTQAPLCGVIGSEV